MNELIQPILALGGLGYLNYIIYSRIDNPDFGSESDKKFMILLYSSMNYLIFMMFSQIFKQGLMNGIFWSIVISLAITLIFPVISRLLYKLTNFYRGLFNLAELQNTKLKENFFEDTTKDVMFIFSIPDDKMIASGYISGNSRMHEDFSVCLFQFAGNEEYCRYIKKEGLLDYLEDKNLKCRESGHKKIDVGIYVNIDKKIEFISFSSAAVEQSLQ
ncbi:hypothetical protein SM120_00280 [Lactococcus lactis subsp. lactis]|uniref:hypothetical protein n=1 Tax=Lactococcus lactis TaxID=1358 RepID=UPI002A810E87|nr:hypothetical protein [Lactococcus lactis]MDY4362078.1 hypothetical protein [Lactococcus lactis subsp. lactis]